MDRLFPETLNLATLCRQVHVVHVGDDLPEHYPGRGDLGLDLLSRCLAGLSVILGTSAQNLTAVVMRWALGLRGRQRAIVRVPLSTSPPFAAAGAPKKTSKVLEQLEINQGHSDDVSPP